ncbi:bifunctional oligoribonuclease/PAP phosphatase NrnA [Tepidibacillus infernus]|uniref:Exopolyphosphatase n=1 Tax=Tepidibacillus decaturensis TaxID=1413211 RepID=A0A135L3F5_9BACI|nr:bifunctional oligoribonuclease/PAP phosphatase NrnA [Tepidibacillus decaturensis]KXG43427.1 hypothetical protein U473_04920 [Tepidibacillus decaturensis]
MKDLNEYKRELSQAGQFIKQHDNYLIVSHINPDGDTISSSLTMALLLRFLGKSFTLVNEDPIPDKFNFLPLSDQILSISEIKNTFSHVITVDVADQKRMGMISPLLTDDVEILNIDHHPTNDRFGHLNVILPTAAATCEIMYDLVKELNIPLSQDLASCIYTGLLTDTGGFRYTNTSPKVMRIAAELLEYGVSPGEIAEIALETISKNHISVLQIALSHLQVIENGFIAWTYLKANELPQDVTSDDTEGIVNYTRNIEGVEVGIFFKEVKGNVFKISLRSKKYVDVGAIAKAYHGGGHARASGFTFYGDLEEVLQQLIDAIKQSEGWKYLENKSN